MGLISSKPPFGRICLELFSQASKSRKSKCFFGACTCHVNVTIIILLMEEILHQLRYQNIRVFIGLYIYIYLNWCRVSEPSTIWIPINHYGMSQPTNRTGASSDWQGQLSRSDNVASCGADWSHVDVHPAATGQFVDFLNMGVSENRGTPKSSILIGFSSINHPFWGTPIFGNIHIGL